MDDTDDDHDALNRMHALREKLRAAAEARIEALAAMPVPDKPVEVQRQLRTIATADRLVIGLFSPPPRRVHRSQPRPEPQPKPRPQKPEPSPFMQSMDDVERSLKQIASAHEALADVPLDMAVPPALAEALKDLSQPSQGPAALQDQAIALARFSKELTTAKALHRLKTSGVELPPALPAAYRGATALARALDIPAPNWTGPPP